MSPHNFFSNYDYFYPRKLLVVYYFRKNAVLVHTVDREKFVLPWGIIRRPISGNIRLGQYTAKVCRWLKFFVTPQKYRVLKLKFCNIIIIFR